MDSEVKARWLEALRSGQYTKGKSVLRSGDRYCCLGVLAEVEGFLEYDENRERPYFISSNKTSRHSTLMPDHISSKYGLGKMFDLRHASHQVALACINDQSDTFDDVIEYIEKNL
jgi:hypothetical protein